MNQSKSKQDLDRISQRRQTKGNAVKGQVHSCDVAGGEVVSILHG
ncbi:MAG: hypothetical protein K0Q64_1396 [Nitrobacter vulgaris]|jgi:hypothetical protein|nr:hypothetical protein [Nitrobacter vulgaris]